MDGFLVTIRPSDAPGPEPGPARIVVGELPRGVAHVRRGPLAVAADVRLDNRDALRAALRRRDEASDSDLLLAAYEAWGDDVASHLDGPFSFVIWDESRRRAVFARDGLGLRPLYRARVSGAVVLGSSLPALQGVVPRALCPEAVVDHLAGTFRHPALTLAAGVERVGAGTTGVVEVGREGVAVRERRFWSLDPSRTVRLPDDAAAEGAFRDAFDRAVEVRLGGRVGTFLSGGLDSSSISVTARALRPGHVFPSLSIVYDSKEADERRYVDAVLERGGFAPVRLAGPGLRLFGNLDDDLAAIGEPYFTPNLFLQRALYAEARRLGLDAVLDGFAGDSVVWHGDGWLTDLALGLRWRRLAHEARAVARRSARPRRAALHLARDYVLVPLVPRLPARPVTFAHPDLPRARPDPRPPRTVRAAHHAEMSGPVFPRAFEVAYAAAASLGVEPRFPFADRPLVELCLALPPDQKLRDGLTRSILRRAMAGRLPDVLARRPGKARIGGNFSDALFEREVDTLRQFVHDDAVAAAGVLDLAALRRAAEEAIRRPERRAELAVPVWRAATLARWLSLRP